MQWHQHLKNRFSNLIILKFHLFPSAHNKLCPVCSNNVRYTRYSINNQFGHLRKRGRGSKFCGRPLWMPPHQLYPHRQDLASPWGWCEWRRAVSLCSNATGQVQDTTCPHVTMFRMVRGAFSSPERRDMVISTGQVTAYSCSNRHVIGITLY